MIRLAQPHGPYVVFGLCVSGALAFEAAQQLIAEGEEPPLVVLNDTWRPGFREEMKMVDRQLRAWQVRIAHWRRDIEAVRAGRHSLAEALRHHPMPRALKLPEAAIALGLSPPFSDTYGAQELSWYADYLGVQQKRYRPAPYPGRVLLMRSQEVMRGRLFPHDLGWHEVAPMSLAVVECPGAHATMFRDAGAEVIAIHMRAQMQALGWDV
jgi:thioesterase domain-containing protein